MRVSEYLSYASQAIQSPSPHLILAGGVVAITVCLWKGCSARGSIAALWGRANQLPTVEALRAFREQASRGENLHKALVAAMTVLEQEGVDLGRGHEALLILKEVVPRHYDFQTSLIALGFLKARMLNFYKFTVLTIPLLDVLTEVVKKGWGTEFSVEISRSVHDRLIAVEPIEIPENVRFDRSSFNIQYTRQELREAAERLLAAQVSLLREHYLLA